MSFEGWLKQSSLTPETFKQDLRKKATRRWKLRLGMEQLIEELSINIPDPEVDQRMQAMLNSVPPEQYSEAKERMADPETRMSLKWQMTMEKLMETLLAR
jgi:FKBP-type peptidyl-prolyl cis-trans isomerase (trigger factor)